MSSRKPAFPHRHPAEVGSQCRRQAANALRRDAASDTFQAPTVMSGESYAGRAAAVCSASGQEAADPFRPAPVLARRFARTRLRACYRPDANGIAPC